MKFSAIPCLLLAAVARSNPLESSAGEAHLVRRATGISVVEQGLYNISNSTVALTKSIAAFSLSGLFTLQAANADAVNTIYTAAAQIKNIETLTATDAINLVPIISMLVEVTNKSVETTIDQKRAFGGIAPVVKANLQQQLQASTDLNTVIATKLPSNLVSTAAKSSAPIYASVNMGIEAFSTPFQNTPQNSPELFSRQGNAGMTTVAPSMTAFVAALAVAAAISVL